MADALAPPSDPFAEFKPSAADPFDERWLSHLLRRAGFGPSVKSLDQFKGKSLTEVLDALFTYDVADDPLNAKLDDLAGFIQPFDKVEEAQDWWIYRMLNTSRPLQERVAFFWHGHFATAAGKGDNNNAGPITVQIDLFRTMGLGNFRELLVAVSRDPAMLMWLDGQTNRRGKPNENYGREVMELFTLGVGNYTEKDVQQLARCFTGWNIEGGKAKFNRDRFDDGDKEIFGQKDRYDSKSACDLLLAQPAAPKFIARKLIREFLNPYPTDDAIAHYSQRLLDNKWEIKPVLREILSSRAFFSDWSYRAKIKSPVDIVIGATLSVGGVINTEFARASMAAMGQSLLLPPNVKGWDGQEAWINANTVLQRMNFGLALSSARNKEFVKKFNIKDWLEKSNITTKEAIVDQYARLLLDSRLKEDQRAAFLDFMDKNPQGKKFEFSNEMVNSKVREIIHLMMAMPEYQLA